MHNAHTDAFMNTVYTRACEQMHRDGCSTDDVCVYVCVNVHANMISTHLPGHIRVNGGVLSRPPSVYSHCGRDGVYVCVCVCVFVFVRMSYVACVYGSLTSDSVTTYAKGGVEVSPVPYVASEKRQASIKRPARAVA